jgi:hypothetical protein
MEFIAELDDQIAQCLSQFVDDGGNRMWICSMCNKCGKDRTDMTRHCETHFSVVQSCQVCGKTAKNREALRTHTKTYHKRIHPSY